MEAPTSIDYKKLYEWITPEAISWDPKKQILIQLKEKLSDYENELNSLMEEAGNK